MRAWLAALAAGLLIGTSATAGGYVVPTKRDRILVLAGDLEKGDVVEFRDRLRSIRPDIVVLDRPNGRLDEALLIAAEIRRYDLNTFLPPRRNCITACAIMFLAGKTRYAGAASEIALYPGMPVNLGDRNTSTISVKAVLDWVGAPANLKARIASSPPDELYWVDEEEKSQLGIVAVERSEVAGGVAPGLEGLASAAKPRTPWRRQPNTNKQLAAVAPVPTAPEAADTQFLPIPSSLGIADGSPDLGGVPYEHWYWAGHGIDAETTGPFEDLEKLVPTDSDL